MGIDDLPPIYCPACQKPSDSSGSVSWAGQWPRTFSRKAIPSSSIAGARVRLTSSSRQEPRSRLTSGRGPSGDAHHHDGSRFAGRGVGPRGTQRCPERRAAGHHHHRHEQHRSRSGPSSCRTREGTWRNDARRAGKRWRHRSDRGRTLNHGGRRSAGIRCREAALETMGNPRRSCASANQVRVSCASCVTRW